MAINAKSALGEPIILNDNSLLQIGGPRKGYTVLLYIGGILCGVELDFHNVFVSTNILLDKGFL